MARQIGFSSQFERMDFTAGAGRKAVGFPEVSARNLRFTMIPQLLSPGDAVTMHKSTCCLWVRKSDTPASSPTAAGLKETLTP